MVPRKIVPVLALSIIPFMVGCAAYISPDVIYKLQDDVRDVKKDVSELKGGRGGEEGLSQGTGSAGSAVSGDVELALRKDIASIKADIEALRGEISTFQAFVDETKYQMSQDQQKTSEKIREAENKLLELEGKVETLMALKTKLDTYEGGSQAPPPRSPAVAPPVMPEKERVVVPERETVSPVRESLKTPEDLYDYGLGLIKANKFREARKSLDEFGKTYPKHRLMPNVYYWRGETFYAEKDFESAAITFQEVIDRFPDSPKAPDALFKQGMCFFNMDDPISAKAAFNLLLSKYPTSVAAGKAKSKLSELDNKGG